MPFTAEEISCFFDDIMTVDAAYSHDGVAAPTTIKVIFDNAYQLVDPLNGGVGVMSASPSATCKTADVSNAVKNGTLVISGVTYYIREMHPDGTGITILLLSTDQV